MVLKTAFLISGKLISIGTGDLFMQTPRISTIVTAVNCLLLFM